MSNVDKIKQQLQANQKLTGTTEIKNKATEVINAQRTSLETTAGAIANEINGGVQSLTQKFDKAQNILNNTTTEGLLSDASASVENLKSDLVNQAVSKISGAFGAKVEISFSEVTVDGQTITLPDTSSLDATGGVSGALSSVIQLITGLGVTSIDALTGEITQIATDAAGDLAAQATDLAGTLQAAVVDASPAGLLKAGKDLAGKIGGFSATTINSLATDAVTSVTNELETLVNTAADINKSMTLPISLDDDDTSPTFGEVTNGVINATNMPSLADEWSSALNNIKTEPLASLNNLVRPESEIRQNLTSAAAKRDFSQLSGGQDGEQVIKSVQTQTNLRNQYAALQEERNSMVQTRVAGGGSNGIIQELSTETLTDIRKQVKEFAPSLTSADVNRVINLSQGNSADFSQAVELLFQATGKSAQEIRAFLKTIDTTITKATAPDLSETVFDEPYVIGSFAEQFKAESGIVFPYISSVEELQAELRNAKREITEVVVHWSETPTNKNIGSEEIHEQHLERNLNGIGYHYVIRRDGSLQRGRPINLVGEHAVKNSHNERSIGIVFVGGINVPSETPNLLDYLSVQSLTRSQFNTFDHFCRAFYNTFAGGQIVGHSDVDELASDPGFDVRAYVKANFDKDSKFTDPVNQEPFTVDEINS
jgi:hypothetical protein